MIVSVTALVAAVAGGDANYLWLSALSAALSGLSWWIITRKAHLTRSGAGGLGVVLAGAIVAFTPFIEMGRNLGVFMMLVGVVVFANGYQRSLNGGSRDA